MPDLSERNRLETILPALDTARLSGGSRLWRLCLPIDTVPRSGHGTSLCASSPRGPDLRCKRDDARDSECQIGHDRIVTWRKIHPSHQMFFSPTVVNPFRKPPRGAHTDARNDAKHSHVQHSSTCKHGPSRDQAGTRRCVPHVAPRPEPFARHAVFFPGNLAGYFSPRCDPQRASRPAFPRIVSPRDIRERYVRVVSRRSFRASRLGRPTPTLPAGSTFVDPSRIANSRCAFRRYRLLFPADSGDWQGWGAPDIHDDDGEPRARSPRSSVNLSSDSRRNSIDEPVRRRSVDLRNHGGGEGAIQGLDDPPLR